MQLEVEQKFPLTDAAAFSARVTALGAAWSAPQRQVDRYFAHPARDFAHTDEALRLRQVGSENFITYKGPKLDQTTKTRRELELPIAPGEPGLAQFSALLEALGFRPVAEVVKQRRQAHLVWEGQPAEITLDEVEQVGQFAEIELLADEASLDAAKQRLLSLAARLELHATERRSYLELLLDSLA